MLIILDLYRDLMIPYLLYFMFSSVMQILASPARNLVVVKEDAGHAR